MGGSFSRCLGTEHFPVSGGEGYTFTQESLMKRVILNNVMNKKNELLTATKLVVPVGSNTDIAPTK